MRPLVLYTAFLAVWMVGALTLFGPHAPHRDLRLPNDDVREVSGVIYTAADGT